MRRLFTVHKILGWPRKKKKAEREVKEEGEGKKETKARYFFRKPISRYRARLETHLMPRFINRSHRGRASRGPRHISNTKDKSPVQ